MKFDHYHIHLYSILALGLIACVVYIITLRNTIDNKIESLKKCDHLNAEKIQSFKDEIELHLKTVNQLANSKELIASELINKLKSNYLKDELAEYKVELEKQLKVNSLLKSEGDLKDKEIVELKFQKIHEAEETKSKIEECKLSCTKASSCIQFGNSSGIHEITVPGYGSFPVLYDSQEDGPGWIVIQKRINGNVDFNRSWTEYRNGFGSLDGDFFLGLEKLHRLTTSSRYELSVHFIRSTGVINIECYDNFVVAGEEKQYKLQSLGTLYRNAKMDCLRDLEGQKFSTFDRDNDASEENCAMELSAGWWYNDCIRCWVKSEFRSELFREPKYMPHKILIRPLLSLELP